MKVLRIYTNAAAHNVYVGGISLKTARYVGRYTQQCY